MGVSAPVRSLLPPNYNTGSFLKWMMDYSGLTLSPPSLYSPATLQVTFSCIFLAKISPLWFTLIKLMGFCLKMEKHSHGSPGWQFMSLFPMLEITKNKKPTTLLYRMFSEECDAAVWRMLMATNERAFSWNALLIWSVPSVEPCSRRGATRGSFCFGFLNMKQVKCFVNPICINRDQEMRGGAFCIHWLGVFLLPSEALLV